VQATGGGYSAPKPAPVYNTFLAVTSSTQPRGWEGPRPTVQDTITKLQAEIGNYGVTASPNPKLYEIVSVRDAVDSLATQAAGAINQNLLLRTSPDRFSPVSKEDAFRRVFGATHINITSSCISAPGFPCVNGVGGANGVNRGMEKGVFQIEIRADRLSGPSSSEGSRIVAHELGHNLTIKSGLVDYVTNASNPPTVTLPDGSMEATSMPELA
jgi:hypothetical protein